MSGFLSNAISGLQASQNALRTTGHNISNASTAGYSRQEVNYVTRPEHSIGSPGFVGSGVTTESIERVVNEFVTAQLRTDTSVFNQLSTLNTQVGKLDKLFADASTGMSGAMQTFFAALQNGANDPASLPARQLIVAQTDNLSVRFNNLHQRLTEIESLTNSEIASSSLQIGSLAKSIASLNQSISDLSAGGQSGSPNDLLDQRDEALRKLSELVSIQVVTSKDSGHTNVYIGNGEPLVIGVKSSNISVTNDGKILFSSQNASTDVTSQISGGKLGGLLQFRENTLEPAFNELGRLALVFSNELNRQNQQGIDLDGDYGQRIFADVNSDDIAKGRVIHGNNAAPNDRQISLTIDDVSKLSVSDYEFSLAPGSLSYIVTRLGDNKVVSQGTLSGVYPASISFDGVSLNLQGGSFQGGDKFTLQPTKTGARDITSLIQRPEDLAFASPVRTGASTSNAGSGLISAGHVVSLVDANGNTLPTFQQAGQLSPPVIIRFTSATTYDVLDNSDPSNPKHLVPPITEQLFVPGISNAIFSTDKGETKVTGQGDRVGLPDGRNADVVGSVSDPLPRNGYLAEQLHFTLKNTDTGAVSNRMITTRPGASAMETAAQISSIPGVSARAYTTANVTGISMAPADQAAPTQIFINGQPIIAYDSSGTQFAPGVPDINLQGEQAFNDYLATSINANPELASLGIRAESGTNAFTGAPELRLVASSGVDLDIRLRASAASSIDVNDATTNPSVRMQGADNGAGELQGIVVGGRIDLTLASGVSVGTAPSNSPLFGDSKAADFAKSSFVGYQVEISGQPKAGDTFTIGFNTDGSNDNRNALALTALETTKVMHNGTMTLDDGYGKLVEDVAVQSNLANINMNASKSLLEQTQTLRDSISGVNLDEEAGELVRYQQLYQANAQVISVARELFNTLLGSF